MSRVTTDATPQGKGKRLITDERLPKALIVAEFTVRTRWVGDYFKVGSHDCARLHIKLVREVDPFMHVIPTTEDSDDFIVHEDEFDDDSSQKWLRNLWCLINTANEFTIRFRCTKSFKFMRETIIRFMEQTGNGAKVDCNKADRVEPLGFLIISITTSTIRTNFGSTVSDSSDSNTIACIISKFIHGNIT